MFSRLKVTITLFVLLFIEGLMWPSLEELAEIKEMEAEWEPSLEEMKRMMNERKQQEAEERRLK